MRADWRLACVSALTPASLSAPGAAEAEPITTTPSLNTNWELLRPSLLIAWRPLSIPQRGQRASL